MPADPETAAPRRDLLPLMLAAARVCIVQESRLVARLAHELAHPLEQWSAELLAALERSLKWIAQASADPTPEGIPCWLQDPDSNEQHRIPRAAIWRALHRQPTSRESDGNRGPFPSLHIFAAAIADTWPEHSDIGPRYSVQIGTAALEARTSLMFQVGAFPWLDDFRFPEPPQSSEPAPEAMEMLRTLGRMVKLWTARVPLSPTRTKSISTKDAVAQREAEYRSRWLAKDFEMPKDARDDLEKSLNTRPDRSVAQPGEPDHHARATIDRLTRAWFGAR